MALAFDAAASSNGASTTSLTYSHTCTGTNLILLVGTICGANSQSVTGVTYNGVAMTKISGTEQNQLQNGTCALWYLINPSTGANNVVVSLSSDNISSCSASYTSAKQSGQPDNSTKGSSTSGTTFSTTLTTVADNCWTVGIASVNQFVAVNVGTSTTRRAFISGASGILALSIFDSNTVITPAGSNTLNYSSSSGGFWIGGMASVAPFVAGSSVKQLSALGVG